MFTVIAYAGIDNAGIFGRSQYAADYAPFTAVYAIDNGSISGASLTVTGYTYDPAIRILFRGQDRTVSALQYCSKRTRHPVRLG